MRNRRVPDASHRTALFLRRQSLLSFALCLRHRRHSWSSSAAENAETDNDDDDDDDDGEEEEEEEEVEGGLEEESLVTSSPAMIVLRPPATAAGHVSAHGSVAALDSPPVPSGAILSTVVLEGCTFTELSPEETDFIRKRRLLLAAGTLL